MFRKIRMKLFGRPNSKHWTVSDLIADPPGFDDPTHPLTMCYIQMETRWDSPGRVFVEKHREEVKSRIEKALTHRDQLTRIKLCGILSLIDPRKACDHLISIVCTEIVDQENHYQALHLINLARPSNMFSNEAQQRQLFPHLIFLDPDHHRPASPSSLPVLDHNSYLMQRDSMDILFSMNIPEAAETAHIYLDDPLFGEDFGLYLAKMGDPAGWPALRRLIGDVNLGTADIEFAVFDIRDGLYGLADWIDLQSKVYAQPAMLKSKEKQLANHAHPRSMPWDLLKALSSQNPEHFLSFNTENTLRQIDEMLKDVPLTSIDGGKQNH